MRLRQPKKAFTLIELLVVVSIIALLVSILLPALGKARQIAKRTICTSNVHQIGLTMMYYTNDNNDTYMFYNDNAGMSNPPVTNRLWYEKLISGEYLNSTEILTCPSHKLDDDLPLPQRLSYGMSIAFAFDYAGVLNGQGNYNPRAWKMSDIRFPSEIIVVVDSANAHYPERGGVVAVYAWWKDPLVVPPGDAYVAYPRDGGWCGTVWADGHGSSVKAPDPDDPSTIYDQSALTSIFSVPDYWVVTRNR